MKRVLVAVSALLFFGVTAFASTMSTPATVKVGLINLPQILQHSDQVKTINKKLQEQFKPQQTAIVAAQNKIRSEAQKLGPNATPKLTADQKKAVQTKIMADQKQLQQMVVTFQQKVGAAQAKAMHSFIKEVNTVVKGIAKKNGLALVLVRPAVIYAGNSENITQQVLAQLPKK